MFNFYWKKNHHQCYTSTDKNTIIEIGDFSFHKGKNSCFTPDVKGKTVILNYQYSESSQDTISAKWPADHYKDKEEVINIENGTLILNNAFKINKIKATTPLGKENHRQSRNHKKAIISIKDNLKIKNSDYINMANLLIDLSKKGHFTLNSGKDFFINHNVTIRLRNKAKITIQTDHFLTDRQHKIATPWISFYTIKDNASLCFSSFTPDTSSPFDFKNNIYPAGLFNFVSTAENGGRLIFENLNKEECINTILKQRLITIDGVPQSTFSTKRIKCSYYKNKLIFQRVG